MIFNGIKIFDPNKEWIFRIFILPGNNIIILYEMNGLANLTSKQGLYLGCFFGLLLSTT